MSLPFGYPQEIASGQCSLAPLTHHIRRRIFIFLLAVACGVWYYGGKRLAYQLLYGQATNTPLQIAQADHIIDVPEQPLQRVKINGFDIDLEIVKGFQTTTRIVYVDRYSALGSWYRSQDWAKLYDKVVPQDLSFATGQAGQHPECFNISHDYRFVEWEQRCSNMSGEIDITNNHTIAATKNVQKALDILKAGDIAYIEGFLINWKGTEQYSDYQFESATELGQTSKQLIGGHKSGLCRQLYLTKITFDGYTFE